MKKTLVRIITLVFIAYFPIIAFANSTKIVPAKGYSFSVPGNWNEFNNDKKKNFKAMLLPNEIKNHVKFNENFNGFRTPTGFIVIIYDFVYKETKPTLEKLLEQNKQQFQMGIDKGIVKLINFIDIIKVGGKKVLKTDWTGGGNSKNNRNVNFIMPSENQKTLITIMSFFPGIEESFPSQIKKIVESVSFNKNK